MHSHVVSTRSHTLALRQSHSGFRALKLSGFYSNVNPNVDHPRWSQATERRIGEDGKKNF